MQARGGVPSGVGGWLLVLCIILTIVVPADIAYQTILALRSGPSLSGFVFILVSWCLAIFSLTAGLLLWRARPGAVTTAKLFLLTQVAFAVVVYVNNLLASSHSPESAQDLALAILPVPFSFAIIWYSYLSKSRRVQATYPQDYSVVTKKL